jgi:hypothetical protein
VAQPELTLSPFLAQFGFTQDPFESTNAEREFHLDEYFVPPPYFADVLGNPADPTSRVVFAPRGGGKTAQRRMIEIRSEGEDDFLCITYVEFDQPGGMTLEQATWAYHVNQLCRLILVGILVRLDDDAELIDRLTDHQKALLKFQIDRFLGSLSRDEFEVAVRALKNFGEKTREFLNKWSGPLQIVINAVLSKLGLEKTELPSDLPEEAKHDESLRYHFANLLKIAQTIGFSSTYILVDKVDEIPLTVDASKTFDFIRGLVLDLPTLEAPGVAFKFFLWDQVRSAYLENGARPDRIRENHLNWSVGELAGMLSKRLAAYSAQEVDSFNALLCGQDLDAHQLVAQLANGSPRDMIRICSRIVAEQTRTSTEAECVSEAAVWAGVRTFCEERAGELFRPDYLDDLRRIGKPTFTISHLASDIFRVKDQSARRKVQLWSDTGIVARVGEVPNPPNRPMYLFGVVDPRVTVAMMPTTEVPLILGNYVISCPHCGTLAVSDRDEIQCPGCSASFQLADARSLLELVST